MSRTECLLSSNLTIWWSWESILHLKGIAPLSFLFAILQWGFMGTFSFLFFSKCWSLTAVHEAWSSVCSFPFYHYPCSTLGIPWHWESPVLLQFREIFISLFLYLFCSFISVLSFWNFHWPAGSLAPSRCSVNDWIWDLDSSLVPISNWVCGHVDRFSRLNKEDLRPPDLARCSHSASPLAPCPEPWVPTAPGTGKKPRSRQCRKAETEWWGSPSGQPSSTDSPLNPPCPQCPACLPWEPLLALPDHSSSGILSSSPPSAHRLSPCTFSAHTHIQLQWNNLWSQQVSH